MNETNKKSISREINNLGWLQILAKRCRYFHSFNNMSHHNNDPRHTSTVCRYAKCRYAESRSAFDAAIKPFAVQYTRQLNKLVRSSRLISRLKIVTTPNII